MAAHNIGYIRVSTTGQNTDRQLTGAELDQCFTEKVSAKDRNRPELERMLKSMRPGDCVHVHSIDRLARNMADLLELVKTINGAGCAIRFHKEGLTFSGDASPMQVLQLNMMGAFAQFERSLILERANEGRAAAKERGVKFGRKAALGKSDAKRLKSLKLEGWSVAKLAREFSVSRQTVYRTLEAA